MRYEETLIPISIFYLVLLFLIWQSLSIEFKLIASGLLTALLSVWCGAMGVSVQMQAGQAGVFMSGDAAGSLGRIAAILILAGVALTLNAYWKKDAVPVSREEANSGKPL